MLISSDWVKNIHPGSFNLNYLSKKILRLDFWGPCDILISFSWTDWESNTISFPNLFFASIATSFLSAGKAIIVFNQDNNKSDLLI